MFFYLYLYAEPSIPNIDPADGEGEGMDTERGDGEASRVSNIDPTAETPGRFNSVYNKQVFC